MPPEEDNRAAVRRLFEAVNGGDDVSLDELVAPDCEIIGPAGAWLGPAIYRRVFGMLRAAFPDMHVMIEEMLEPREPRHRADQDQRYPSRCVYGHRSYGQASELVWGQCPSSA